MRFLPMISTAIATVLTSSISGTAASVQAMPLQSAPLTPPTSVFLGQVSAQTIPEQKPEVGTIQRIQQGDTMCYITFRTNPGNTRTVGALFEFCANPQLYLNQRMRLVYGVRSVNDCPSEEPCGKTRQTNVVIRMDSADANSVLLRNRDWTIRVGNRNSWSGVNGTGNLTY
jgi:hypothetical protein